MKVMSQAVLEKVLGNVIPTNEETFNKMTEHAALREQIENALFYKEPIIKTGKKKTGKRPFDQKGYDNETFRPYNTNARYNDFYYDETEEYQYLDRTLLHLRLNKLAESHGFSAAFLERSYIFSNANIKIDVSDCSDIFGSEDAGEFFASLDESEITAMLTSNIAPITINAATHLFDSLSLEAIDYGSLLRNSNIPQKYRTIIFSKFINSLNSFPQLGESISANLVNFINEHQISDTELRKIALSSNITDSCLINFCKDNATASQKQAIIIATAQTRPAITQYLQANFNAIASILNREDLTTILLNIDIAINSLVAFHDYIQDGGNQSLIFMGLLPNNPPLQNYFIAHCVLLCKTYGFNAAEFFNIAKLFPLDDIRLFTLYHNFKSDIAIQNALKLCQPVLNTLYEDMCAINKLKKAETTFNAKKTRLASGAIGQLEFKKARKDFSEAHEQELQEKTSKYTADKIDACLNILRERIVSTDFFFNKLPTFKFTAQEINIPNEIQPSHFRAALRSAISTEAYEQARNLDRAPFIAAGSTSIAPSWVLERPSPSSTLPTLGVARTASQALGEGRNNDDKDSSNNPPIKRVKYGGN